jgi:hypothetical protein
MILVHDQREAVGQRVDGGGNPEARRLRAAQGREYERYEGQSAHIDQL